MGVVCTLAPRVRTLSEGFKVSSTYFLHHCLGELSLWSCSFFLVFSPSFKMGPLENSGSEENGFFFKTQIS